MSERKFLYGTHYSAPGYVLYYLVRSGELLWLSCDEYLYYNSVPQLQSICYACRMGTLTNQTDYSTSKHRYDCIIMCDVVHRNRVFLSCIAGCSVVDTSPCFLLTPPHTHTHTQYCSDLPPTHTHTQYCSDQPPHTHTQYCSDHPPPPHTHTHTHTHSIAQTWENVNNDHADVKELIPEFYQSTGNFLLNTMVTHTCR